MNIQDRSSFVVESLGHEGLFGIFEDDGDTGYLYLYELGGREILCHLHIYDRSKDLSVIQEDVEVVWSRDFTKVGVLIWGKMRGIIFVASGKSGRVWLENRDSPGVADEIWLEGF